MTTCIDTAAGAISVGDTGLKIEARVTQGADLQQIVLSLQNDDGTFVDVTGANIVAEVRKNKTEASPVAVFVVGAGPVDITLDLPGSVTATLAAGQDMRDPAGRHYWKCRITFLSGAVRDLVADSTLQVVIP